MGERSWGPMQITKIPAGLVVSANSMFPGGLGAAAAAVSDPGADLDRQISAYRALAAEYRASGPDMRTALAPALNESAFARRAQATMNSFTRAAWAGSEATPPEPQVQALKAFDGLSADDQKIVAALQDDSSSADYRKKLAADLETAYAQAPKADSITLSPEAQARLAGKAAPETPAPPAPAQPDLAAAIAAYAKAARA